MNRLQSNVDTVQAAQIIAGAQTVVVLTHAKPDGDAFGAVVALTVALRRLGKRVRGILSPPILGGMQALRGAAQVEVADGPADLGRPDLVVVVDTAAWSQLAPLDVAVRPLLDRTMVIDHHLNGDMTAAWRCVDGQAAAACEIVAQIIDHLAEQTKGDLWTSTVREAVFAGIASDTGWFRFSNTRPRTHRLAARLIEAGVDHAELYRKIEQTERPQKLALMIRALDSLELLADGRVALMVLRRSDFEQCGANDEETERFVDVPQIVDGVDVVVLAAEQAFETAHGKQLRTRLSFRSKPGPGAVNVAALAERYGGGGHARAAGAKVEKPMDDVLETLRGVLIGDLPVDRD